MHLERVRIRNRLIAAHRGRRRIVFLVGAGLSLPPTAGAPGVPGAGELVRRVTDRLKESGAELPEGVGNPRALEYQEALELYRHYRGQRGLDELVREAVLEACVGGDPDLIADARAGDLDACRSLERTAAAWALPPGVEALGRLIAACPDTFGTAVFTTNFDPLVEVAIRRAGGQSHTTFLAEDGRFSARHGDGCHVIHVHGLWSGEGFTAHTVAQLTRPRPQLRRDLERFLERSDLVVLGYGGWKDVFSDVITSILIDPAQRTEVLWCFYEAAWAEIETRYAANLERLAPGLDTVVVPYAGIDGNGFLPRLAQGVTAISGSVVRPEEDSLAEVEFQKGRLESGQRAVLRLRDIADLPPTSPALQSPPTPVYSVVGGTRSRSPRRWSAASRYNSWESGGWARPRSSGGSSAMPKTTAPAGPSPGSTPGRWQTAHPWDWSGRSRGAWECERRLISRLRWRASCPWCCWWTRQRRSRPRGTASKPPFSACCGPPVSGKRWPGSLPPTPTCTLSSRRTTSPRPSSTTR